MRGRALLRTKPWGSALLLVACALIVFMYWTNIDMGGDWVSRRGDGRYRPVLARGDGHMLYLMARSTALDGDWVFDNDLARFGDPWGEPRTKTGRKSIVHPIGPALVWTPLIWIAEGGAVVANQFGSDIPLHGYTLWHQRFVFLSSALFACGAVLLGRRIARRAMGDPFASCAAVCVLLGTSLTYYATHMPSYAHAMDAFACAAFLSYWADTVGRCDIRRWCALGLLLGTATLIRVQECAMGVIIALEVAVQLVRAIRARTVPRWPWWSWLLGGLLVLLAAAVVFIPQLVEWHLVFGAINELPQGAKFTRPGAPMVAEVLFSSRNGWFSTTPIAYAGVLGLFVVPKRLRLVGAGLLITVAIQVYLNSTILDWWGGAAFGQRRLCSVTLPLVVGLTALIWRLGHLMSRWPRMLRFSGRALTSVAFAALLLWNLRAVRELARGKAAPESLVPTCCSRIPGPLRGAARWIYERFGNPFQFPANAFFAMRHAVPLSRWDVTVGNYPLVPGLADLHDTRRYQRLRGVWPVGATSIEPYLVGGWSRAMKTDRPFRFTTEASATVLVPNLIPDGQRLTLWLAPGGTHHARILWNGETAAEIEIASGWTSVVLDVPTIALHTNELAIESIPRRLAPQPGWPSSDARVGVAVGNIEVTILPQ